MNGVSNTNCTGGIGVFQSPVQIVKIDRTSSGAAIGQKNHLKNHHRWYNWMRNFPESRMAPGLVRNRVEKPTGYYKNDKHLLRIEQMRAMKSNWEKSTESAISGS